MRRKIRWEKVKEEVTKSLSQGKIVLTRVQSIVL